MWGPVVGGGEEADTLAQGVSAKELGRRARWAGLLGRSPLWAARGEGRKGEPRESWAAGEKNGNGAESR